MDVVRVLVVEDDPAIAAGIVQGLVENDFEVELETRGDLAARRALDGDFDVIVIDLMLPYASGFDVLSKLRSRSRVPVLVLTARTELADRLKSFELGAVDFVCKPFFLEELVARIRAHTRERLPPNRVIRFGDVEVDLDAQSTTVKGASAGLTRTEHAILAYLAERPGRAIAREQLADDVLPSLDDPTGRTVDAHVARLRKKLGVDARSISTVWGIGYRFSKGEGAR